MRPGILLILIILLIPVFFFASGSGDSKESKATASVYDRVTGSGKLRCAYALYNPGCMKDPNTGKLSGIGIEALELVAGNLGLAIEWTEEVGWGTMIEGLETNRYDIVATPVWATTNRARIVDFSDPLYFSPVCAYVKEGDRRFDGDISRLNSKQFTIATIDGATAEIIAQEDYPEVKRLSLPQMTEFGQLLLTVSTGKADATFTEPADAALFIKSNPGSVRRVGAPVRVFPNCWLFRRGQMEFKDMIDTALSQLNNSGALDRIIERHEPAPGILYRTAELYHRASSR